jgi:hypothetical protein
MMKQFFFLVFFSSFISLAQPLQNFNKERTQIDKRLMIGLGSWATSNFIVSGIGWATVPKSEAYYFHQMNVLWNTVNLALAIPGYFKAKNDNRALTLNETKKIQRKTQNIFLLNTGLDVVYISSGFLLRNSAQSNLSQKDRFNGFGNALILQGGFLFIFDLTAYAIHKYHSNKFLNNLEISPNGLGFTWKIGNEPRYKNHRFL